MPLPLVDKIPRHSARSLGSRTPANIPPFFLFSQVNVDNYGEWIQMVAELTVRSLNSWQWAASSVYYLLGLWSRLVSSMQYLKGETPSLLETYAPKITQAYVTSRCGGMCLEGALAWGTAIGEKKIWGREGGLVLGAGLRGAPCLLL